jgi:hypothetical protein
MCSWKNKRSSQNSIFYLIRHNTFIVPFSSSQESLPYLKRTWSMYYHKHHIVSCWHDCKKCTLDTTSRSWLLSPRAHNCLSDTFHIWERLWIHWEMNTSCTPKSRYSVMMRLPWPYFNALHAQSVNNILLRFFFVVLFFLTHI